MFATFVQHFNEHVHDLNKVLITNEFANTIKGAFDSVIIHSFYVFIKNETNAALISDHSDN